MRKMSDSKGGFRQSYAADNDSDDEFDHDSSSDGPAAQGPAGRMIAGRGGAAPGPGAGSGSSRSSNQHHDDLDDGNNREVTPDSRGRPAKGAARKAGTSPVVQNRGRARSGAAAGSGLIDSPPGTADQRMMDSTMERAEYEDDTEIPGYKSLPVGQTKSAMQAAAGSVSTAKFAPAGVAVAGSSSSSSSSGGRNAAASAGGAAKGAGPSSKAGLSSTAGRGSPQKGAGAGNTRGAMNHHDDSDDDDDDDNEHSGSAGGAGGGSSSAFGVVTKGSMTGSGAAASSSGSPAKGLAATGALGGGGGGGLGGAFGPPPANAPGLTGMPPPKTAYNPADYAGLMSKVPEDVRELFAYIGRYTPHAVELETRLKPFIPDYIPAVGEIDPFLKPPRPDGKEETLGLKRLDEPAHQQSDPTVLTLQLRALSKKSVLEPMTVRALEHAEKNPKDITKWIQSISELHRSKPPPSVHYAKSMPDIEMLMQEWPPQFEELLKEVSLPTADTELSLEEFARVACALLDIPVHGSLVQSLHVLFTLYHEFRSNVHFQSLQGGGAGGGDGGGGIGPSGASSAAAAARYNQQQQQLSLISDDDEDEESKS